MTEQPGVQAVPEFHMGDRLAKALDVANVSVAEMAEYLGVSRNTIGNYTAMRRPVTIGTLRLWALRTGVRLEWLQTGKVPSGGDPGDGESTSGGRLGKLPRLDSNQQPSGYTVRATHLRPALYAA